MFFHIPLDKVEKLPIKDYRLMLFTIFNSSVLNNAGGEFKYKTDFEEQEELDAQVEYYKKKGFFQ